MEFDVRTDGLDLRKAPAFPRRCNIRPARAEVAPPLRGPTRMVMHEAQRILQKEQLRFIADLHTLVASKLA
jgi:hypothetical protein